MTDSVTSKFSDDGDVYKEDETPFGHVHHMAESLTHVSYEEVYDQFLPRPKLRINGYAACLRKKFCGQVLEKNKFEVYVNNSKTNRRRKIPDAMPIHAVNEYVRKESTGEWFRVAFQGPVGPSLRQGYVTPPRYTRIWYFLMTFIKPTCMCVSCCKTHIHCVRVWLCVRVSARVVVRVSARVVCERVCVSHPRYHPNSGCQPHQQPL